MSSSDFPPQVLLVEGQDDKQVVKHLCTATESAAEFGSSDKGGVDGLLAAITPEIKVAGRRTVGLVVDANDNPAARWQAISDRLRKEGIPLPERACSHGTVIAEDTDFAWPRIGIWLMPDNETPGELEDFIASMIPPHDVVWPLSREYIRDIPEPRKFKGKTRRAEVHAWLATREKPRRMGQAITARDLDVDSKLCQRFVAWLRRLFGEEAA